MKHRTRSHLRFALLVFVALPGLVFVGDSADRAKVSAQPSVTIDVDLLSDSTGIAGGTLALRIFAPAAIGAARYPEGAPVVVYVLGGTGEGSLRPQLPWAPDVIRIVFLFPGGIDRRDGRSSDGSYDLRGPTSIAALRDVIRYAAGQLTDSLGRTIDDVAPVPVLHDNIGLFGSSNGGNIVIAVAAQYGATLAGYLRYIIQWESPVSSQIVTSDLGGVRLDCPGSRREHQLFVNPRYRGYGLLGLDVDYTQLAYDPSNSRHPVFWDGNGDRTYTTTFDPDTGCQTPDLDLDGVLEMSEDFPLRTDGARQAYSRQATQALADEDTFGGRWPAGVATPTEADAFWDLREAVRFYSAAMAKIPGLEGMVLTSVVDHVQSAPDKPHIRQAFEGWEGSGAWVRINPGRNTVLEVDPGLSSPSDLPDNTPNTAPADWTDAANYAYPDGLDEIYFAAAVHEMGDRAHAAVTARTAASTALPTNARGSMAQTTMPSLQVQGDTSDTVAGSADIRATASDRFPHIDSPVVVNHVGLAEPVAQRSRPLPRSATIASDLGKSGAPLPALLKPSANLHPMWGDRNEAPIAWWQAEVPRWQEGTYFFDLDLFHIERGDIDLAHGRYPDTLVRFAGSPEPSECLQEENYPRHQDTACCAPTSYEAYQKVLEALLTHLSVPDVVMPDNQATEILHIAGRPSLGLDGLNYIFWHEANSVGWWDTTAAWFKLYDYWIAAVRNVRNAYPGVHFKVGTEFMGDNRLVTYEAWQRNHQDLLSYLDLFLSFLNGNPSKGHEDYQYRAQPPLDLEFYAFNPRNNPYDASVALEQVEAREGLSPAGGDAQAALRRSHTLDGDAD